MRGPGEGGASLLNLKPSYSTILTFSYYKASTMATKMKGIYKGFKYISQIFVVKEREMEIGYPTDVKHVAHIGWDSQSSNAPGWMNEFKTASDFSSTSLGNIEESRDPNRSAAATWTSQDFERSMGHQPASEMFKETPPTELPKKHKRKKTRSSLSSSSSRSARAAKSKASYAATVAGLETVPNQQGLII